MAEIINSMNFEEKVLKSDIPVLVDFYADWCSPCRMMMPVVDRLDEESNGAFAVYKVNVDKSNDLALKYRVMTIPTLVVFKGGQEVDRLVGAAPFETLQGKLKSL